MSKGPGKWQRAILSILESKKESADYRHVHKGKLGRNGQDMGLIERCYPELWAADKAMKSDINDHPLEYGWISVGDLCQVCGAESMAAYKAILRALDTLENAGTIQSTEITSPRKRLVRINVDRQ